MWKTLEMMRTLSAHQKSVTTDGAPDNVLRMEIPLGVIIVATYVVLGHCLSQGEAQPEEEDQDGREEGLYMAETGKTGKNAMDWWQCSPVSPFH